MTKLINLYQSAAYGTFGTLLRPTIFRLVYPYLDQSCTRISQQGNDMFSPSFRPGLCWFAEHCRNTQVRQWLYGTQYMTGTHHLLLGLRGFTEPLHLCFNVILGQPFNFIQINILFPPKKSSAKSFIYLLTWQTRTHSMAPHRKSSRSLRNLMVIGPLTPTQGDQFECRLIFFSVSWSTDHPLNLICHITMFRKLNF